MREIREDAAKDIQNIIWREEDKAESCKAEIAACLEEMESIIKQAKEANAKGCFTMGEAELLHRSCGADAPAFRHGEEAPLP